MANAPRLTLIDGSIPMDEAAAQLLKICPEKDGVQIEIDQMHATLKREGLPETRQNVYQYYLKEYRDRPAPVSGSQFTNSSDAYQKVLDNIRYAMSVYRFQEELSHASQHRNDPEVQKHLISADSALYKLPDDMDKYSYAVLEQATNYVTSVRHAGMNRLQLITEEAIPDDPEQQRRVDAILQRVQAGKAKSDAVIFRLTNGADDNYGWFDPSADDYSKALDIYNRSQDASYVPFANSGGAPAAAATPNDGKGGGSVGGAQTPQNKTPAMPDKQPAKHEKQAAAKKPVADAAPGGDGKKPVADAGAPGAKGAAVKGAASKGAADGDAAGPGAKGTAASAAAGGALVFGKYQPIDHQVQFDLEVLGYNTGGKNHSHFDNGVPKAGVDIGDMDGANGDHSQDALSQFKKANGLAADADLTQVAQLLRTQAQAKLSGKAPAQGQTAVVDGQTVPLTRPQDVELTSPPTDIPAYVPPATDASGAVQAAAAGKPAVKPVDVVAAPVAPITQATGTAAATSQTVAGKPVAAAARVAAPGSVTVTNLPPAAAAAPTQPASDAMNQKLMKDIADFRQWLLNPNNVNLNQTLTDSDPAHIAQRQQIDARLNGLAADINAMKDANGKPEYMQPEAGAEMMKLVHRIIGNSEDNTQMLHDTGIDESSHDFDTLRSALPNHLKPPSGQGNSK